MHKYFAIVLLACVSSVDAGTYPSSWKGEFDVFQEIPDIAVPRVSILATYGGKVPIAVGSSGITGTGTLSFHLRIDQIGCTMTSHGGFKMKVTGNVAAADAGSKGKQLKLKVKRNSNDIGGQVVCPHDPALNQTLSPHPISDGGPLNIPLADKSGPNTTYHFGGTTVEFKMQLTTPCAKWDSRKEPGPTLKLDPDPRTLPLVQPLPEHTLTVKQLTALEQANKSEEEVLVDNLMGRKALGLTLVPFDIKPKFKASKSKPQINIYKECVSVDEVSVEIPILDIKSFVASDLSVNNDCERLVEAHEIHHVNDARDAMISMASEIEVMLPKKVHGPFNAYPSVVSGWDKMEEQTAENIIADIVKRHKTLWEKERDALDAHDKAPIKAACKNYL